MRAALLTAAFCLLTLDAARAQGFCFGRAYTSDHLARHPAQNVEEIFFGTQTGRPILQVLMRGSRSYLWGYAACRDKGDYLACDVENDQGVFTVSSNGDGTILIRVGEDDVRLERGGDQEIAYLAHDRGDDRVFKLYAGKGCIN